MMQIGIAASLLTSLLFHLYVNAYVFSLLVEFPHALHAMLKIEYYYNFRPPLFMLNCIVIFHSIISLALVY